MLASIIYDATYFPMKDAFHYNLFMCIAYVCSEVTCKVLTSTGKHTYHVQCIVLFCVLMNTASGRIIVLTVTRRGSQGSPPDAIFLTEQLHGRESTRRWHPPTPPVHAEIQNC